MLYDVGEYSEDLYFGAAVAVEVEDGFAGVDVFLFEDEGADVFAFVVEDGEVDAFDEVVVEELFLWADGVDVVGVFVGGDDSFPGPFEVFSDRFHQ